MKLLINHADRFNELVFEHRNKNYGAYEIRKTYSNAVIKACIITFSAVALLLGSAVVANNLTSGPPIVEIPKSEPIFDTINMTLQQEQKVKPEVEPVKQQVAASAAPSNPLTNIQVVNETVTATPSVNVENPLNGQGGPNAQGTSLTSTLTTSNTGSATVTETITIKKGVDTVVIAQEMPEYEGGTNALLHFLGSNIVYPEMAKAVGKEGTVYISFIVDENGYVSGAKVIRGIGYGCDEEALRVVNKIPKWKKSGRNNGQPVRVRFNLPISFRLK